MHSYCWQSWNKQCNAYLIMHAIIFKPPLCSPASLSVFFCVCLCLSSMDRGDAEFLKTVLGLGCEVHSFDPSNSNAASGGHLGNSLASNHGDGGVVSQHKMWLEWRAPRKRKHKTRGNLGSVSQTLADIMATLGHHTVRDTHTHIYTSARTHTENWRNSAKQTYLRVFSTQHTQKALLLVRSHSNRALRHPWLPWQQFK